MSITDDFDVAPPSSLQLGLRRAGPALAYAAYAAVAAAVITGVIPPKAAFLALSGTAALGILAIAIGFRRHYVWAHTNCNELDEREQKARARAYEVSYGIIIAAGFLFFAPPLLVDEINRLPAHAEILKSAIFGFMLLASTLPTAILAWRDRAAAMGGVGRTGRVSRRTLIFWSICGTLGLGVGFLIGYLA